LSEHGILYVWVLGFRDEEDYSVCDLVVAFKDEDGRPGKRIRINGMHGVWGDNNKFAFDINGWRAIYLELIKKGVDPHKSGEESMYNQLINLISNFVGRRARYAPKIVIVVDMLNI